LEIEMKRESIWKQVLIVLCIGLVGYALYAIYKAFQSGERTISGLIKAPFTAISDAWTAITGMFSSAPVAAPLPGTITNGDGVPIATVAPSSPFYSSFAPTPDQASTQELANWLLGNGASGPVTATPLDLSTPPLI
jgi:hypothetical protein